jgi:hypothetical protein
MLNFYPVKPVFFPFGLPVTELALKKKTILNAGEGTGCPVIVHGPLAVD